MSYHMTFGVQAQAEKYPFALFTEADQIILTKEEMVEFVERGKEALDLYEKGVSTE